MERCGLRADIVIDGKVELEIKAQGTFGLDMLRTRWIRLNRQRPDLVHVLVGWRHNRSTISRIREFIPESNHFFFHNLSTCRNEPKELERLVTSIIRWLESAKSLPVQ